MDTLRGRPPKPTADSIDSVIMALARELLDEADESRRGFRAAPAGVLRRALLAVRLSEALDVLANSAVRDARSSDDPVTWADVGDAFGISAQSAQRRFG